MRQVVAKSFEPAAHARVEPHGSGLEDDASDQVWVNVPFRLDLPARGLLDTADETTEILVRQLVRGRQLDVEDARLRCDERVELVDDGVDLGGAALLGEQLQEVDDEVVRTRGDARQHVRLHPRVDLGVLEQQAQLVDRRDGVTELLQLRVHLLELPLLLRGLEERARIDALGGGYDRLPSSALKSISASASSIRRCWSAPVSVLRVIFSAASSDSFPTSSRICARDCAVACSICRRVSSRRRW